MKRRDLVLSIIGLCGASQGFGRTSLQKVSYFASVALREPLGYHAYYYGPFSDVVESEAQALVLSGLVEEKVEALGFVGASGFDARKYEYRVTKDGEQRIKSIRIAHTEEFTKLEQLVKAIRLAAGGFDQGILSAAAKTHFIVNREGQTLDSEQIQRLARDLGWNLGSPQIKRVQALLMKIPV